MRPQPSAERAAWTPRAELDVLNTDIRRVDGPQKVTGQARYTHDIRLPGMVYARLIVHPYPRSIVGFVDVEPALALDGVVYAKAFKEAGDDIRFQGADAVVAVVAAETLEALEDGVRAVQVEVDEQLPALVTREQALEPDAPVIGRGGNTGGENEAGSFEETQVELDFCDAVVKATYTLPVQHHVCLETHGCVVDYQPDGITTVYVSIQMVSASQGSFARQLGLPADKVRVITEHMGGGFGSKFQMGREGAVCCDVAKELGRPVHLMLSRPQEFLMAGNRSGSVQTMVGGATRSGELTALTVEADRLGGLGGGSLPSPPYIYRVGSVASRVRSVHTATDSSRAMRAPGHPQASFAMESLVDELAYAIEMDPLEFRKKNLEEPVYARQLDRVAHEIGWHEHDNRTQPGKPEGLAVGIGFGVSTWGSGAAPGTVCEVRIAPDGTVVASTCTQDLGQGTRTLVAAIVAEEFGLRVDQVTARIGDSDLPPSVGSGGSVTTGSLAPAVKMAAHNAREAFAERVAAALGAAADGLIWRGGEVSAASGTALAWSDACALLGDEPLVVTGEFAAHLRDGNIQGAQAAKVSVDTLTGEIKVLKMVCCQNQGLPLNRMALRSQINGGMVQALSYGLFEERVHDPDLGLMLSCNLEDYKIAGVREMPEMIALIDDEDTRPAVMGMAEATVIPGHAAIANAIFNACGVRLRDLPMTSDKVLMALEELRG